MLSFLEWMRIIESKKDNVFIMISPILMKYIE